MPLIIASRIPASEEELIRSNLSGQNIALVKIGLQRPSELLERGSRPKDIHTFNVYTNFWL